MQLLYFNQSYLASAASKALTLRIIDNWRKKALKESNMVFSFHGFVDNEKKYNIYKVLIALLVSQ